MEIFPSSRLLLQHYLDWLTGLFSIIKTVFIQPFPPHEPFNLCLIFWHHQQCCRPHDITSLSTAVDYLCRVNSYKRHCMISKPCVHFFFIFLFYLCFPSFFSSSLCVCVLLLFVVFRLLVFQSKKWHVKTLFLLLKIKTLKNEKG